MRHLYLLSAMAIVLSYSLCHAIDPALLYVKPGDMPPMHFPVEDTVKCVDCHPLKIRGIDGYTSATMTLKKSTLGVMPREEIAQRVVEVLQGKHGREIFVLATSHNNKPLATIIEFVIDPKTMNLYAMSERQGEKLFHMNENNQVSLAYVRPAENYFRETLGVQIVGKAELLSGKDPGFAEGLEIYFPTILYMLPNPPTDPAALEAFKESVRKTKIMTKITPERIVLRDNSLKVKNARSFQVWEQ
jgi:nitroimidazol reductase NimA-like FMN-containing flavoprotein (pyridoxamine 5'-phosphate oxidase superfamily)